VSTYSAVIMRTRNLGRILTLIVGPASSPTSRVTAALMWRFDALEGMTTMAGRVRDLIDRVRTAFCNLNELEQRRELLDRPWEEDFLHWAADGTLHGDRIPPATRRRYSTTSGGWCPRLACAGEAPTRRFPGRTADE
jgi:hypothetical protein